MKCPETRSSEAVHTETQSGYFAEEKLDSSSKEMQVVTKREEELTQATFDSRKVILKDKG